MLQLLKVVVKTYFYIVSDHFSAVHLYKDIFEPDKYRATVQSSGVVRVAYSGDIHTVCVLDDTFFPFDHQICHVEFDSWTLPMSMARFSNDSSLVLNNMRANGLWDIEDSWKVFTEDIYLNVTFRTISFTFM